WSLSQRIHPLLHPAKARIAKTLAARALSSSPQTKSRGPPLSRRRTRTSFLLFGLTRAGAVVPSAPQCLLRCSWSDTRKTLLCVREKCQTRYCPPLQAAALNTRTAAGCLLPSWARRDAGPTTVLSRK
ncbi:hypothetical protein HPB47_002755, partial [Ixodes persulcatus]